MKISCEIAEIKIRLQGLVVNCRTAFRVGTFAKRSKVEEILKGSLDSIPSPSVKIQVMGGKVRLWCKDKTFCFQKFVDTSSNVLPYYLK